jgi:intraflagellar transport protein 74
MDRPVTQQGLSGLKTGYRNQERMVQDVSYWTSLLHQKMGNINKEVQRMQTEILDYQNESQNGVVFERRSQDLATEIREFQGKLGDYNTLLDHFLTDPELLQVQKLTSELQSSNVPLRTRVDALAERRQQYVICEHGT